LGVIGLVIPTASWGDVSVFFVVPNAFTGKTARVNTDRKFGRNAMMTQLKDKEGQFCCFDLPISSPITAATDSSNQAEKKEG